jgi:hypothetical protein
MGHLEPGYSSKQRNTPPPPFAPEAIAAGIWELIYDMILYNRAKELPALTPQLTHLALTPFLGASKAAQQANSPLPP